MIKETLNTRRIKKVAVLGSGIMGSQLACHLANIGLDVILFTSITLRMNTLLCVRIDVCPWRLMRSTRGAFFLECFAVMRAIKAFDCPLPQQYLIHQ